MSQPNETHRLVITMSSKDDCVESLLALADELGHSPTYREYRESEKLPSTQVFRNLFGDFNSAKGYAGLSTESYKNNRPCFVGLINGHMHIRHGYNGSYDVVPVHRLVAYVDYELDELKNKSIHHDDHNPIMNARDNLTPMTKSEHQTYHRNTDLGTANQIIAAAVNGGE